MNPIRQIQAFIDRYVTFTAGTDYSFPASLWVACTYLWPTFDTFPYLVITSDTKRSGKTRFSEVLSFVSSHAKNFAGMTAPSMFRAIGAGMEAYKATGALRDAGPTIIMDEAETLSSEEASLMRAALNIGYRKGQTIPRPLGDDVREWPVYCPKVFVLIGDVYDTLRDRSIIMRLQRGTPRERFMYDRAKSEGDEIRTRLLVFLETHRAAIESAYAEHAGLTFLSDRDEEIWTPLFAVASVVAPERIEELQRIAVDMCTEKTAAARRYVNLAGAEQQAEDDEYARRLVHDMVTVAGKDKVLFTKDALARLHELPTGPWRKFRGTGLNAEAMANLLARFGIEPKLKRVGGHGPNGTLARGYVVADLARVAKAL